MNLYIAGRLFDPGLLDAVNGSDSPTEATPENAHEGLGCDRFGGPTAWTACGA